MGVIASQITSLTIVYSSVYSGADQRKHHSSSVTGLCAGNSPSPVNSPHKGPVTRKMLPFDDVIMQISLRFIYSKSIKSFSGQFYWRLLHYHKVDFTNKHFCCSVVGAASKISILFCTEDNTRWLNANLVCFWESHRWLVDIISINGLSSIMQQTIT